MTAMRWTQDRPPDDDEDEKRLEEFPAPTVRHVIPKLLGVLIGVTLAALVLARVGITGHSLLSQLPTGPLSGRPDQPPGQTDESFTPEQLPAVTEKREVADSLTLRQRETSGPFVVSGTVSREASITSRETSPLSKETSSPPTGASTAAIETDAPPKAGTGQGSSSAAILGTTVRPSPSAPTPSNQVTTIPAPEAATPKATELGGSHHAKLVSKPVSRGWGDSYVVRLLDPAGKPLAVAQVVLVAHMADGSVEYIAMGALPEQGTYRGTVPTGHSTPVDLRIRVSRGDKFVEVPVRR